MSAWTDRPVGHKVHSHLAVARAGGWLGPAASSSWQPGKSSPGGREGAGVTRSLRSSLQTPPFVKCCYQFTNKIEKEGLRRRKDGKVSSELYSKPAIKSVSPLSRKRCRHSPAPEHWDLSCRQAQERLRLTQRQMYASHLCIFCSLI